MTTPSGVVCERCGAHGTIPHEWTEGTCLLPHRYDRPTHPPLAKVGFCCTHCLTRHETWLDEIVELYAGLPDVIEPGSTPDDTAEHQHVKKRPASPAPVRLDAWAMLHDADRLFATGNPGDLPDVTGVLAAHAEALIEALDWTTTAPDTVSGLVALLRPHGEVTACQPWVDEYDADLRWVRRALRRAHGITNPRPLGACLTLDCEGQVWRDQDGDQPKCDRCSRRYGTHDIVRLHVNERASA